MGNKGLMIGFIVLVMGCGWRIWQWKSWEQLVMSSRVGQLRMTLLALVDKRIYDCRLEVKGVVVDVPMAICKTSRLYTSSAGDDVTLEYIKAEKGRIKATSVVVKSNHHKILVSLFWWQRKLEDLRQRAIGVFKQILPEPESGLMAGIVLGEKGMLSSDFSEALIKTVTMHVVAASGYNVAVIAAVILKISLMFFSRRKASIASILMIWVYVFMAGADPSVIRAGIMACLVMLSWMTGREYWVVVGFGMSAILMLLVSPWLISSISFQLSL